MRYVTQEPIVTTISDEDVNDEVHIKSLLIKLKDEQQSVYMEFEDADNSESRRSHDNVRVTEVRDNEVDIHAFMATASVRYKRIPLLNIHKIRILANKQTVSQKYKVTRWRNMDVAEIE